jgi:hypothetical protein
MPELLRVAAARGVGQSPRGLLAGARLGLGQDVKQDGEDVLHNHRLDLWVEGVVTGER